MARKAVRSQQLRTRVAQQAARLIAEHGIRDYQLAKRKAAEQLGLDLKQCMPRNDEIEEALRSYQQLFDAKNTENRLEKLRAAAIECMRLFTEFKPLLTGRIVQGTATAHTPITLHIFCENPRVIATLLMDHNIEFDASEKRLRINNEQHNDYPCFLFSYKQHKVELLVLPHQLQRQAPLSKENSRPMKRLNLSHLSQLQTT